VLLQTGQDVDVIQLDLASLETVDDFVKEFTGKYRRCDVLMNNAGVMAGAYTRPPFGSTEAHTVI
jgi:NADP-dependent 3-hydroxy acid dehydrogenase YdfG